MALTHLSSFLRAAFPPLPLASEAAQAQSERHVPPTPYNCGTNTCADLAWTSAISRAMSYEIANITPNVPGGTAAMATAAGGDPGIGLSSGSSATDNLELDAGAGGSAVAFVGGETTKAPVQSPWRADRPRSSPLAFEEARKKPFQDMSRDVAKDLVGRLIEGARIERPDRSEPRSRPAPSTG